MALYRITAEHNMPESTVAQTVFHLTVDDGPTTPASDVLDAIVAHWGFYQGVVNDIQSSQMSFNRLIVHLVTPGSPPTYTLFGERNLTGAGEVGTTMLPHGVAIMARVPTGTSRVEGRVYIPALATTNLLATGIFSGAAAVAAALAVDELNSVRLHAPSGLTTSYVVVRASTGFPFLPDDVVIVDTVPDYQRRRKPGRGI